MWEETVTFFFLVFTDYRFSMFIFLKAVFFTVRSHLSFPLGCSFLLSLIVMKLDLYRRKKKTLQLIFLVFALDGLSEINKRQSSKYLILVRTFM